MPRPDNVRLDILRGHRLVEMHHHRAGKSGDSRLSSGTARNAAMTSPARNTVPALRRRSALASASGTEAHGGEFEELAAEQIAVDHEECADVDAGHQQAASAR